MAPMAPIGPLNPLGTEHTQQAPREGTSEEIMRAWLQGNNDRSRGKPYGHSYKGEVFGATARAYREGFNEFRGERK